MDTARIKDYIERYHGELSNMPSLKFPEEARRSRTAMIKFIVRLALIVAVGVKDMVLIEEVAGTLLYTYDLKDQHSPMAQDYLSEPPYPSEDELLQSPWFDCIIKAAEKVRH